VQRRPIHRPLLGLAGSGSACLAGSCCQSWNGFNGVPGVRSLFVYEIYNAIAAGCRRKEASFCMLPQIDRRADAKSESQCGAVLGCDPARSYRVEAAAQKQNSRCCVDLPCARRRKSKWRWSGHGVTNGALRYEAAETVRKEGQAVMCTGSKQHECVESAGR